MNDKKVTQLSSQNRTPSRGEIRIFTGTKESSSKSSSALTLVQSSYPVDCQIRPYVARLYEDDNLFLGWNFAYLLIGISLAIGMIWVGVSILDVCNIQQVPLFLIISGSFTCAAAIFRIVHIVLNRCRWTNKLVSIACFQVRQTLCFVVELCLLLWGTVILGANYSVWTWEDSTSETFCTSEALGLLFFVVIYNWLIPILMCCGCCGITLFCIFTRRPSFKEAFTAKPSAREEY